MKDSENEIRIGVTGATGTLGRALVGHLVSRGYTPVCLVRPQTFSRLPNLPRGRVVAGDLNDESSLREFVAGIHACVHLAAYVGQGSAADYHAVNVQGTQRLCEAILQHNPSCRLVYCSTIAALRISKSLPFLATPYARSKRQATDLVKDLMNTWGLKGAIVYPGLVYGPGDDKFVPAVIENLKKQPVFLVTGGHRNAPLIYVDDLCELLFLAATKDVAIGKEYLGVNPFPEGIHAFFRIIAARTGARAPSLILPKMLMMPIAILVETGYRIIGSRKAPPLSRRVVDILSIHFGQDSRETNAELGWRPGVAPEEGIGRFLDWMAAPHGDGRDAKGEPHPNVA